MSKITQLTERGWVKCDILEKCSWSQYKIYFTYLVSKRKDLKECLSCTCAKSQLACSKFCRCRCSYFNKWLTDNSMMRMEKNSLTNRHFYISYIVQSYSILFIFIYDCIMHIAIYFQFFWLYYKFPRNCFIWYVLVTVTSI